MPRRKRKSTVVTDSPSAKIPKKCLPRLNHRGRMALMCFFAIKAQKANLLSSTDSISDLESINSNPANYQNFPIFNENIEDEDGGEEILNDPEESSSDDLSGSEEEANNLFNLFNNENEEESEDEEFVPYVDNNLVYNSGSEEDNEVEPENEEANNMVDLNEDGDFEPENESENNEDNSEDNDSISTNSTSSEEVSTVSDNLDDQPQFLNFMDVLVNAVEEDENESGTTSSYVEEDRCVRRSIMISRQFLYSYFNDMNYELLLRVDSDFSKFDLIRKWEWMFMSVVQLSVETLVKLIKMSNIKKIDIMSYPVFDDFTSEQVCEAMKNWIQVCRVLKESKNLTQISIQTGRTRASPYRIFFDLLPDKLCKIKAHGEVVHLLNQRKSNFKSVCLFNPLKNIPDYSQIFKTKTTKLDLCQYKSVVLNDLATCGRLSANPLLEELKIRVKMDIFHDQNDTQLKDLSDIERALNCLKSINSRIKLELTSNVFYGSHFFKKHKLAISQLKERLIDVRKLIDLVKSADFEIHKISISDNLILDSDCPDDPMILIGKEVGLKLSDDETLCDSLVYNGVEIRVKIKFAGPY